MIVIFKLKHRQRIMKIILIVSSITNLQGIVDEKLKLIHATIGYPDSIHDVRVLRVSGISDLADNEQILRSPTCNINGTEIGPLIAGDSTFPLTSWLMKPSPDMGRLTPEQKKIN